MDKAIRVLNITNALQAAGIESFIMNIYRNIDRSKVQFDFMVMRDEKEFYDEEINQLGGNKYTINVLNNNSLIKVLSESIQLYRFLKRYSYCIVHIHATTPVRAFYAYAAKKAGVPVRIYHSHSAFVPGKNLIKVLVYSFLKRKISKWATACFACSLSAADWMFEKKIYCNKVSKVDFSLIYNAININEFVFDKRIRKEIRDKYNVPECKIVLGHVGRMTDQKNASFAIDIFEVFLKYEPNSELWLIGEGELLESITKKIHEKGLEGKAILFGNRSDVGRMMQAMDCFVFPSLYEGLGIVLIEAQTAGLKVFTSDVMPLETRITDDIFYLSLKQSALSWAEFIYEKRDSFSNRKDNGMIVNEAGYDINKTSMWFENYYISKISC